MIASQRSTLRAAVTSVPSLATTIAEPYSTRRRNPAGGNAFGSGKPTNALATASATLPMVPSVAWSYSTVTPRTSPPCAAARTTKFFSPWLPRMKKPSDLRLLEAICRWADFFSSSNSAGSAASESRNVSIWIWPCAELQRVPLREAPSRGTSFSGTPSRTPVLASSISSQPTASAEKLGASGSDPVSSLPRRAGPAAAGLAADFFGAAFGAAVVGVVAACGAAGRGVTRVAVGSRAKPGRASADRARDQNAKTDDR